MTYPAGVLAADGGPAFASVALLDAIMPISGSENMARIRGSGTRPGTTP